MILEACITDLKSCKAVVRALRIKNPGLEELEVDRSVWNQIVNELGDQWSMRSYGAQYQVVFDIDNRQINIKHTPKR